jgi:hypothetical protein
MTKIITRVISTFDTSGNATLVIPNHAESVSLKFYENPPDDIGQQIAVILLLDDPPIVAGTHERKFVIVPDGQPVPVEFKKYVATFPYGPNKILVHCIEVGIQEMGSFNPDTAVIS